MILKNVCGVEIGVEIGHGYILIFESSFSKEKCITDFTFKNNDITYICMINYMDLMKKLGYFWSNEAQIFFNSNGSNYSHITQETAERLCKYFNLLGIQIEGTEESHGVAI